MPASGIAQVLSYLPPTARDPNLLVGTETHDDAGVYRVAPDLALVQTLDFFPPVVDDPFTYGQIAAANSLSDVYAMGGRPLTHLNIVGYPDDKLDMAWLGEILRGAALKCAEAGSTLVGGHTVRDAEIKFGLSVTGTVHPDRILTNATAKPGDVLVLTKALGTGFVTTAAKRQACPEELLKVACASMAQLNKTGCEAMLAAGVSAATDVTGFGLVGHGVEMADGSNVTLLIRLGALPVFPGIDGIDVTKYRTRAIKSNREYTAPRTRFEGTQDSPRLDFAYDPQTSGGLLIAVPTDGANELIRLLTGGGALAAVIGEALPRQSESLILTN